MFVRISRMRRVSAHRDVGGSPFEPHHAVQPVQGPAAAQMRYSDRLLGWGGLWSGGSGPALHRNKVWLVRSGHPVPQDQHAAGTMASGWGVARVTPAAPGRVWDDGQRDELPLVEASPVCSSDSKTGLRRWRRVVADGPVVRTLTLRGSTWRQAGARRRVAHDERGL